MRVILITGGTGSLGKALAKELSKENKVIITGLNQEEKSITDEIGCEFMECNVTNWDSVKFIVDSIADKFGKIDVLINSAGIYTSGKIEDIDPKQTKQVFEVNAVGPLLLYKAVVPHMKLQGDGQIIEINSTAGLNIKNERSVYYGSKWALTGITKNLQHELSVHNIKVSSIYPGPLEKTMLIDGQNHPRKSAVEHQDIIDVVNFILTRKPHIHIRSLEIQDINYK